ncbi:MAG: HPr kinase/phosphorylase [Alphaproteobacteria bacterium]
MLPAFPSMVKAFCLSGGSGTGKSDLALRLIMDKKAVLVADDRVELELRNSLITASAPLPLKGLLEVRGIGIMTFPVCLKSRYLWLSA